MKLALRWPFGGQKSGSALTSMVHTPGAGGSVTTLFDGIGTFFGGT
jgi:hypothetical protein